MKKLAIKWSIVSFIMIMVLTALPSVILADSAPGLNINGSMLITDISPGQTYIDTITVSSAAGLNMQAEACGLGQSTDGSLEALTAQDDNSAYSARSFISNIDVTSFQLQPNVPQNIKVTITVPAGTSPGERYADIYLYSQAVGQAKVGVVVAANIPLLITVPGNTANPAGEISDLNVPKSAAGSPLEVDTMFKNTGTSRIAAKDTVIITDQSGKIISQTDTPAPTTSIIPTFSFLFPVTPQLPDPSQGLTIGQYFVESKITLADGTLLDDKKISFNVTAAVAENTPTMTPINSQSNTNNPIVSSTGAANQMSPINPVKPVNGPLGISWAWAGIIIGAILLIGILFIVIMLKQAHTKKE